jgi:hypothetical protein
MPCYALTQQIQFSFASSNEPFTAVDFLETLVDGFTKPLDLSSKVCALKVEPQLLERVAPARSVLSND